MAEDAEDGGEERRIDRSKPGGWAGGFAKGVTESAALREGASDVAGFVFEWDRGEDFVRNIVLLMPNKGGSGEKCSSGDEPDGSEKRKEFAEHRGKNYVSERQARKQAK